MTQIFYTTIFNSAIQRVLELFDPEFLFHAEQIKKKQHFNDAALVITLLIKIKN